MKKIGLLLLVFVLLISAVLWGSGVIPRQIGKTFGIKEVQKQFPEKDLQFERIEWSKFHRDYIITFTDSYGASYSYVIGPYWFPYSLGQGNVTIEEH